MVCIGVRKKRTAPSVCSEMLAYLACGVDFGCVPFWLVAQIDLAALVREFGLCERDFNLIKKNEIMLKVESVQSYALSAPMGISRDSGISN